MEPEREDERLRGCLQGQRRQAVGLRSDPSCGSELPLTFDHLLPYNCPMSVVTGFLCVPAPIRTGS